VCLILYTKHICAKLITRIVNSAYKSVLDAADFGFGEGRSCTDCIFIICQLTEEQWEFNFFG
jgi:hypothetical protein